MGKKKNVPLFVYQKKRGGAAPLIAMAGKAAIPLAKTLAVKSIPLIKTGVMKIAPTAILFIGKKIREKIGRKIGKKTINSKAMRKAERMIINNVQSNIEKRIMGNSKQRTNFHKRRITRALINSL